MKPRVFISSTYYDLKYLRESLEKFMYNMNFDPVLFEANKVTFEHGKPLDVSCFNEVKTCHIMILIIGGRYGSIVSDQDSEVEKEIYDKEYISITRREYETALKDNIPTFIFIDKNVYGEYNTYKINRDFYENAVKVAEFKFFHVDSINIFKFIDLVSTKAIKSFDRIEEIEDYLKDQISGMFHMYLESLKANKRQDEIFDAVIELKSLTSSMNAVIKEVGKEIIKPETYQKVIDEQFELLLTYFFEKLGSTIEYEQLFDEGDKPIIESLAEYIKSNYLSLATLNSINPTKYREYKEVEINRQKLQDNFNKDLEKILPGFKITRLDYRVINDYFEKIKPLIHSDEQEKLFKNKLNHCIYMSDFLF